MKRNCKNHPGVFMPCFVCKGIAKRKAEFVHAPLSATTGHVVDPAGVDHPAHYNVHPAGVECIDVIEHMPHNIGAAIKYLWRAGLKPGEATVKDLHKAAWYAEREAERIEKARKP